MPEPPPKAPLLQNNSSGWVLVVVAAMLWGTDVLLRPKVLAAGVASVDVVLYEHVALAIIFLPIVYLGWPRLRLTWRKWLGLLFIAAAGSTFGTVLLTKAYVVGDPLAATLLQKLQPGFAILAASVLLRERQKPMFWPWFALALLAAYLISFGFTAVSAPWNAKRFYAAIYAVSAAALWGCCTAVGRWTLNHLEALPVAGLRFILALPMLVTWSLLQGSQLLSHPANFQAALLPLALIVLLPDALGMATYYVGLRRTTASLATLAELAYPATAMLLAFNSTAKYSIGQWTGVLLLLLSLFFIRKANLIKPS